MGTVAQVVIDTDDATLLDRAFEHLTDVAFRWSRFEAESELSLLNHAGGRPVVVRTDTAELIAAALDAWRRTDGRFDPSVHDALVAAGYDRTFAHGPGPGGDPRPALGVADVHVDVSSGVVTLPPDVRLDLGGIGKGFAADRTVALLLDAGARGAAVAIGGDACVGGTAPAGGWPVVGPDAGEPIAHLAAGGFCYSTTRLRRWSVGDGTAHHVIDPATGRPASGGVADVAVAAASATIAEVHATAAIVAGMPAALDHLEATGLDGYLVTDDGEVHTFGRWDPSPRISGTSADWGHRE